MANSLLAPQAYPSNPLMSGAGPAPAIDAAQAPTPADAYSFNANAAQGWANHQREIAAHLGLVDPITGWPTKAGLIDAARQVGGSLLMGTTVPGAKLALPNKGIVAYHGSPHDFDAFDLSKIGTGEGAQAYGHGLYFAGNEGVARGYRDRLAPVAHFENDRGPIIPKTQAEKDALQKFEDLHADFGSADEAMGRAYDYLKGDPLKVLENWWSYGGMRPNSLGRMYEVNLNVAPEHLLDWDKPLSQQSAHVRDAMLSQPAVEKSLQGQARILGDRALDPTGQAAYAALTGWRRGVDLSPPANSAVAASEALKQAGIPGIQYLDGGSRAAGDGTRNYVMFDPSLISIARKYAIPLTALSGMTPGLFANEDAPPPQPSRLGQPSD